jgi:hypothetical protein
MNWTQFIEIPAKILAPLAVLVGGFWILFNYAEGRIHRPRLQLRVATERIAADGQEYLIVRTELSNVGLAKVELLSDGCSVQVHAHRPLRKFPFVMEPDWIELVNIDVFKEQHWVEPSGLLIDSQLVAVPDLADRFLRVSAHAELATKVAGKTHKVALNSKEVIGRRRLD